MRYFGNPAISVRPVGFPPHSSEWLSIIVYLAKNLCLFISYIRACQFFSKIQLRDRWICTAAGVDHEPDMAVRAFLHFDEVVDFPRGCQAACRRNGTACSLPDTNELRGHPFLPPFLRPSFLFLRDLEKLSSGN